MTRTKRKRLRHTKLIENDNVNVHLEYGNGEIYIGTIYAIRRGEAKKFMEELVSRATKNNWMIRLMAIPLTGVGEGVKLKTSRLQKWYRQFGFRGRETMVFNQRRNK